MYKKLEYHKAPKSEAELWRYLRFDRFVSMLENKALFFCKVAKFDDKFEGTYPTKQIKKEKETFEEFKKEQERVKESSPNDAHPINSVSLEEAVNSLLVTFPIDDFFRDINQMRDKAKYIAYANCWHENDYESVAMWKLYLKDDPGVAIKSRFGKLKQCLNSYLGIVHIERITYEKLRIGEGNIKGISPVNVLFFKDKSLEHEQEVRALIYDYESNIKQEDGFYVEVDLDKLIEAVIVAPGSPDCFFCEIKSLAKRYGMEDKVTKSRIDNV